MTGVRPTHFRDVSVVRVALGLHPNHLPASSICHANANGGVLHSRLRVWIFQHLWIRPCVWIWNSRDDFAARRAKVVNQAVHWQTRDIELPEGNGLAIGTPEKTVAEVELLLIHPV